MANFTLEDLKNRVQKGISNYIGFDVQEIFNQGDYITIFGGSVRDSLAGLKIHDVDILCMPKSANTLAQFLNEKYGYERIDLYDEDALNMYKGISLIHQPWTLMNDKKKIIQIIKPTFRNNEIDYIRAYQDLIKNVDLSCCGVYLNYLNMPGINGYNHGGIRITEACKDAIIHCLSRVYEVNRWSKLYNTNRTIQRDNKLRDRGWTNLANLANSVNKLKIDRRLKLNALNFKPEVGYTIWTKDEYLHRKHYDEYEISVF